MSEPAPVQSAAHQAVGEIARFAIIGTIGFIVDASTLKLLVALLNMDLYSGRVVSFLTAATGNWMLNRRFTFRQAGDHAPMKQWLKYLGANAVGFAVNYSTYAALITYVAVAKAHPVLGVAAGSIAAMSLNFTVNKFWVFRART
ncbi:MAG: GtrA family protein [Rhodospirillaceae bacterium]|nr:GtrA family protein [Rhodospirillaceae bacterium]